MAEWLKRCVLRLALVPPEPHVPDGAPESIRTFNPGRNYYRWRILIWLLANGATLAGLIVFLTIGSVARLPPVVRTVWLTVGSLVDVAFVISLPFTYFAQRLNYEMRWYIVTDRSLRIRSGIVWVKELTMTFANIQEIRVAANPLQRLLGLADVEVHSAGGSSGPNGSSSGHVGRFEGLDDANAIRDLMVERLRAYRDSGLGEQAENASAEKTVHPGQAIEEARTVLQEVRALRQSFNALREPDQIAP